MAMPPRKWVGYAFLIVGLLLLFDTYTFLRTGQSPLRVPMSAFAELALAYPLAVGGIAALCAPILLRITDSCAVDSSSRIGQDLEHQSVELRRRRRLPLKKRISILPNRGLIGGAAVLLVLVPTFLMLPHEDSHGIYVRLTPQRGRVPDENCLAGPIVVSIHRLDTPSNLLLNGVPVHRDDLQNALRKELATRAKWEVFVQADDSLSVMDWVPVIEAIRDLHAKTVILTPKLKKEFSGACGVRQGKPITAFVSR